MTYSFTFLEGCPVYLDDVVVLSDTWDDHIQLIGALFSRLAETHLTITLAKCEFARATVTCLGHYSTFNRFAESRHQVCMVWCPVSILKH